MISAVKTIYRAPNLLSGNYGVYLNRTSLVTVVEDHLVAVYLTQSSAVGAFSCGGIRHHASTNISHTRSSETTVASSRVNLNGTSRVGAVGVHFVAGYLSQRNLQWAMVQLQGLSSTCPDAATQHMCVSFPFPAQIEIILPQ